MAKTLKCLPPPVVHLVIGDETLCQALVLLLKCAGIEAEVHPTAEAFLERYDPARPGCLFLDSRLTALRGPALQARLSTSGSVFPIILLTGRGRLPDAVQAIAGSTVDVLKRPCQSDKLIALVETTLQLIDRLLRGRARHDVLAERLGRLTPREHQVLSALIHGKPNKTVAQELGISTRTVEVHRAHLRKKLGIRKISEAGRLLALEDDEDAVDA